MGGGSADGTLRITMAQMISNNQFNHCNLSVCSPVFTSRSALDLDKQVKLMGVLSDRQLNEEVVYTAFFRQNNPLSSTRACRTSRFYLLQVLTSCLFNSVSLLGKVTLHQQSWHRIKTSCKCCYVLNLGTGRLERTRSRHSSRLNACVRREELQVWSWRKRW